MSSVTEHSQTSLTWGTFGVCVGLGEAMSAQTPRNESQRDILECDALLDELDALTGRTAEDDSSMSSSTASTPPKIESMFFDFDLLNQGSTA